jgi:CHASE3 domain sensor protein/signal transduction histidine kinase
MQAKHTRNLQGGFGLSLVLLLASSVASFISIRGMIKSSDWVNHTQVVLQKLEQIISYTKDAETGQRGFLLTHDVSFLAPYNGSYDKVLNTFGEVKTLTTDNPEQQENLVNLKSLVLQRFSFLKVSIDSVQANKTIDPTNLKKGQELMQQCRVLADKMENTERDLLATRTEKAERFSRATPLLIIVAAVMAILITLYFYKRVADNFQQINRLNADLSEKDRQIAARITTIEKIAARISGGDYTTRATDEENDDLGSLSGSLNKMAESLEQSFNELSGKEWLQKGTAELNEKMVGEQSVQELSSNIISFLVNYTGGTVGALYLRDNITTLVLKGAYALSPGRNETVRIGQGFVGQCARDNKPISLQEIGDDDFTISFTAGEVKPRDVYVFPVQFESSVTGVIEVGSRDSFTALHKEFFNRVAEGIGVAINTAYSRLRLQELLEETQSQAEELQAQHSELEGLNTELEAQAHKLQASEEELKVQQEELMETNQELEERSRLLEEKNHLIVVRNLEIQKKAEELAQNAKYKSEFLANMSHELRTPLNSILLLSRLLTENNEKNLKEEQIEYARVIQGSGHGLLELIDEILDLSKIESGKMQLDYEFVSVRDITGDMTTLFGPMAKEKNVAFNVQIDPALPQQIETDKMRLEQVLKI